MVNGSFRVLVATDGSASARAALTTAVGFPWPDGARGSAIVVKPEGPKTRRSVLLKAMDYTSEFAVRSAARSMARRWPRAARLVTGEPVDAILAEARRVRADVVVLGWRGHGAVRRFLTGSVSRGVVRSASAAVLVVRSPLRELGHVLVAFDGSPHAERAVEFVARLKTPPGARVTVFTAIDTMHVPSHPLAPADALASVAAEVARVNEARRSAAAREISRVAKTLSSAGWKVDQVVTDNAPLRSLLAAAVSVRADLLVLGARGVTGLQRLLLGSVAEGALNRSRIPVLVVR